MSFGKFLKHGFLMRHHIMKHDTTNSSTFVFDSTKILVQLTTMYIKYAYT